jgi:sortase A
VLVASLVVASSLGCQIEIATTAAQSEAAVLPESRMHVGTPMPAAAAVAPTLAPPAAVTPSVTRPLSPTVTPAPTIAAVIPAQAPPDRILAPAIKLDAPVIPMGWAPTKEKDGSVSSVWVIPDQAAGWHQDSAWPGHGGNVVLSGHHNMGSEVFRHLVDLKPGDEVTLNAGGRAYRYIVTDRFILPERGTSEEQRRQNAQWIEPTNTERLTLVTCWPYTSNTHRVIVLAKPAS